MGGGEAQEFGPQEELQAVPSVTERNAQSQDRSPLKNY